MTVMDSFRTPTALGSRPRSRVPVTISSTRSIIFIHSSLVNGGTKSDPALLWLWEALVQKMLGVDPAERALRHPIPVPGTRCPRGAGRETLIAPAASTAGQMIWDKFESLRRRAPHQRGALSTTNPSRCGMRFCVIVSSSSQPTRCCRDVDSNHRSLSRGSRFILRKVNCAGIDGRPKKFGGVPMVRIHLPPAASRVRT
jgi:hypothetical protein